MNKACDFNLLNAGFIKVIGIGKFGENVVDNLIKGRDNSICAEFNNNITSINVLENDDTFHHFESKKFSKTLASDIYEYFFSRKDGFTKKGEVLSRLLWDRRKIAIILADQQEISLDLLNETLCTLKGIFDFCHLFWVDDSAYSQIDRLEKEFTKFGEKLHRWTVVPRQGPFYNDEETKIEPVDALSGSVAWAIRDIYEGYPITREDMMGASEGYQYLFDPRGKSNIAVLSIDDSKETVGLLKSTFVKIQKNGCVLSDAKYMNIISTVGKKCTFNNIETIYSNIYTLFHSEKTNLVIKVNDCNFMEDKKIITTFMIS